MSYVPKPVATDGVVLPDELVALTEELARNAHEMWAAQRLKEGWTYGPHRDDGLKRHPGLVPYEDLSESEKKYDEITAMGTLKAILGLGYTIVPPPPK